MTSPRTRDKLILLLTKERIDAMRAEDGPRFLALTAKLRAVIGPRVTPEELENAKDFLKEAKAAHFKKLP